MRGSPRCRDEQSAAHHRTRYWRAVAEIARAAGTTLGLLPGRPRRWSARVGEQRRQIHHHLEPSGRHVAHQLEGHTDSVTSLAALDGDRLASGGENYSVDDYSIIIWNLADGEQLAKLEGHRKAVRCLAALDGGRLASGSSDSSIIIWNLADNTQLAKLEGHTDLVICLAALDGDRLASGSSDDSIIIWSVGDGKQLAKLEGHTAQAGREGVNCLAALADGRLASGSDDTTIRVRPVVAEAIGIIVGCDSTFDFEEAARGFRETNELGDLFSGAVQQFDENIGGLTASAAITTQARVFDAIAKVITTDEDNTQLVECLFGLVRDDDLLPDMKRRGVSDAAIEKLTPTVLFRVVLDAKYAAGPRLLLFVEFFAFLLVMCCFTRVTTFDVLDFSAPLLLATRAVEKTVALFVSFAVLAYFSVREVGQMKSARAIELAQPEDLVSKNWNNPRWRWDEPEARGLKWYALAIPRYCLLYAVLLLLLPLRLGAKCTGKGEQFEKWFDLTVTTCAGKYEHNNMTWKRELEKAQDTWFGKKVSRPILYDPFTFLGLSRAWRGDYWNWIDAATLGCAWAAFVRAAMPGTNLSTNHAAATAMLLWLRLFGFMKNINQSLATFILMFQRIVRDLRVFMLFFLGVMLMFGSAFYLYLGQLEAEEYGFHDDGAPNAFESVRMTIFSLLLLGFIGDYDLDNYPRPAERGILILFLVVVVVIQMNILIAIVSDSYDAVMAKSEALYYRANLELVTETAWAAKCFPQWLLPTIDEAWIKKRLADALEENEDGDDLG